MDILRSIEKNVLNVANNNSKSNDAQILKRDIKAYFSHIADKDSIDSRKKEIYFNKYENARVIASMEYDNFLREKNELMNELKIKKTKAALHDYLKLKYSSNNIPDLYSYQDIRLVDRVIIPRVVDKKPTKKAKAKAVKPPKPDKVNECPENKEINPVTGRCVNKCKDDEERNQETGKCKKVTKKVPAKVPVPLEEPVQIPIEEPFEVPLDVPDISQEPVPAPLQVKAPVKTKPPAKEKVVKVPKADKVAKAAKAVECPEGKEISPLTGRCVNKCKEDEERNLETGKCKKKKK
jgi:hypothetical protein